MNKINKVIEESNKEFNERWIQEEVNKLAQDGGVVDLESIKSFISQRDQKILSAIEEEVEGKKIRESPQSEMESISDDSYNLALYDIKDLLKSAKEQIK